MTCIFIGTDVCRCHFCIDLFGVGSSWRNYDHQCLSCLSYTMTPWKHLTPTVYSHLTMYRLAIILLVLFSITLFFCTLLLLLSCLSFHQLT
jgi:hypothetical protein